MDGMPVLAGDHRGAAGDGRAGDAGQHDPRRCCRCGGAPVTLQRIFALPFRPVMWLIGVPWAETGAAAALMATKTVLNEFVAYLNFAALPAGCVLAANAADPDLRAVRLCQFRQPGHHDRRPGRDGAGTARRDRRPGIALDPVRHAGDLHERGGGGVARIDLRHSLRHYVRHYLRHSCAIICAIKGGFCAIRRRVWRLGCAIRAIPSPVSPGGMARMAHPSQRCAILRHYLRHSLRHLRH